MNIVVSPKFSGVSLVVLETTISTDENIHFSVILLYVLLSKDIGWNTDGFKLIVPTMFLIGKPIAGECSFLLLLLSFSTGILVKGSIKKI